MNIAAGPVNVANARHGTSHGAGDEPDDRHTAKDGACIRLELGIRQKLGLMLGPVMWLGMSL